MIGLGKLTGHDTLRLFPRLSALMIYNIHSQYDTPDIECLAKVYQVSQPVIMIVASGLSARPYSLVS